VHNSVSTTLNELDILCYIEYLIELFNCCDSVVTVTDVFAVLCSTGSVSVCSRCVRGWSVADGPRAVSQQPWLRGTFSCKYSRYA